MYLALDYAVMLAEVLLFYQLCQTQLNPRFSNWKRFIPILTVFCIMCARDLFSRASLIILDNIFSIFLFLSEFLFMMFFYKDKKLKKCFLFLCLYLLFGITETAALISSMLILNESITYIQTNNNLMVCIFSIFYPLIASLLLSFSLKHKKHHLSLPSFNILPLFLLLFIDVLFFVFCGYLWNYYNLFHIKPQLLILIMIIVIFTCSSISIFLLINTIHKSTQQEETKLRLQQAEMQTKMNADISNAVDTLRSLRHDLGSHFTAMQGLLEIGKYEEVTNYLASLNADFQEINQYVIIQPFALAILLNNKISKAQQLNIDLECELFISKIEMEDKDIVTLIGNIIENAIEAAENTIDKKIYFSIALCQSNYLIHCDNSFLNKPCQKNNQFITTKKDKHLHGIGIKNIYSVADKYKGSVQFNIDQRFSIDVKIPKPDNTPAP